MYPEDILRVDRIAFKFLWNKKWDGKCPDIKCANFCSPHLLDKADLMAKLIGKLSSTFNMHEEGTKY